MKNKTYQLLFLLLIPSTLTFATKRKRKWERDPLPLSCNKRKHSLPINTLSKAIEDNDIRVIRNTIVTSPLHLRSTLLHTPDPLKRMLPLELACAQGSRQSVLLLLEYGANPKKAHSQEESPLETSIYRGSPNIVKILLLHGATPTSTIDAPSPLGLATHLQYKNECYYTIAKSLLENGADPNLLDHTGKSPYMRAAINGYLNLLRLINRQYSADPLKLSNEGKSALEYASCSRNQKAAYAMEQLVSKDEEENIKDLLKEQSNDLITGETLLSHHLSQLIILNNKVYTKDFLTKHILHKIGTDKGPCDPFDGVPISKMLIVRLAAHARIPFYEIDHSLKRPKNNSLVAISRCLTPRESVFSTLYDTDNNDSEDEESQYDSYQREIRLLKIKFSNRLRRFNHSLAASL